MFLSKNTIVFTWKDFLFEKKLRNVMVAEQRRELIWCSRSEFPAKKRGSFGHFGERKHAGQFPEFQLQLWKSTFYRGQMDAQNWSQKTLNGAQETVRNNWELSTTKGKKKTWIVENCHCQLKQRRSGNP